MILRSKISLHLCKIKLRYVHRACIFSRVMNLPFMVCLVERRENRDGVVDTQHEGGKEGGRGPFSDDDLYEIPPIISPI